MTFEFQNNLMKLLLVQAKVMLLAFCPNVLFLPALKWWKVYKTMLCDRELLSPEKSIQVCNIADTSLHTVQYITKDDVWEDFYLFVWNL